MKIKAEISKQVISSNSQKAFALNSKSNFGEKNQEKIQYSLSEAFFLIEEGKIDIFSRNKKLSKKQILEKFQKIDKRFHLKYPVFKDLRKKGYIVKTALKFGADFRVYDKGGKPKKSHAKWIVFADYETNKFYWHEFAAKNRVAHSTRKNLLLAIIDEEGSIIYYEIKWVKP